MEWEIKNHIEVKNGSLYIGEVEAQQLAAEFGTPLYIYNGDWIREKYLRIRDSLTEFSDREIRVYYAVKANTSLAILKLIAHEGAYADVVSPDEARIAIDAGFPVEKVMFTGTSVSDDDLRILVELGILINGDSFSQMRRLAKLGKFRISIRWNPGEGAGHHKHVITAGKMIKFGIPEDRILEAYREAVELGLEPIGLHQHIGSGWLEEEVEIFLGTVNKTLRVAADVTKIIGRDLEFVNFGGGLGIPYFTGETDFPLRRYASGICGKVRESGLSFKAIAIEPGRYLVGDAGILLTKITTVEDKWVPLIGVDSGFNTLVRPALYNAFHLMVICNKAELKPEKAFMVAGNLCESADIFHDVNHLRELPIPDEGDILAILDAGAYGFSMASEYNMRGLPAEVMIENGKPRLIRKRRGYKDMLRQQMT